MDLVIDQSVKWNPTQQQYVDDAGYPADFKFTNASLKSKPSATTALFRCEYWSTTDQTIDHAVKADVTFDSMELQSGSPIITKIANTQFKNTSAKPIMIMVHATATTPDGVQLQAGTVFTAALRHQNTSDNIVGNMGEYACSNVNATAYANFNTHSTIYLKPGEYFMYSLTVNIGGGSGTTMLAGGSKAAANIGRQLIIQQIG